MYVTVMKSEKSHTRIDCLAVCASHLLSKGALFEIQSTSLIRAEEDKIRCNEPVQLFSPLVGMNLIVSDLRLPVDVRYELCASTLPCSFLLRLYASCTTVEDQLLLRYGYHVFF